LPLTESTEKTAADRALLDSITDETLGQNRDVEVVRVTRQEEIQNIVEASDAPVERVVEKSDIEAFQDEICADLVHEIGYLFRRFTRLFYEEFPWKQIKKTEARLWAMIDAVRPCRNECVDHITEGLDSGKEKDVTAAVFILCSIGEGKKNDAHIDSVLSRYSCIDDAEQRHWYVRGMKYGLNARVTSRLFFILDHLPDGMRAECIEIISYRNDAPEASFIPYRQIMDEAVQVALPLSAAQNTGKPIERFLIEKANSHVSFLHERLLFTLFVRHSSEALRVCRETCLTNPEPYPHAILLLSMAAKEEDGSLFQALCDHPDNSVKRAAYSAVRIIGDRRAFVFLVKRFGSKEEDESEHRFISDALTGITGTEPDSSSDENVFWQDWLNHNNPKPGADRLRKGSPWSLTLLIDQLESSDHGYDERAEIWQELVIQTGHSIPFEPDWPVDKQIAALTRWKEAVNTADSKGAENVDR